MIPSNSRPSISVLLFLVILAAAKFELYASHQGGDEQTRSEHTNMDDNPIEVFTVSHNVVDKVTDVSIRWEVEGVDSVYITNIGVVAGNASIQKNIARTTRFTLFAELGDSVYTKSIEVEFKGIKSVVIYPSVSDYEQDLQKETTMYYYGLPQLLDDLTQEMKDFYLKESYDRKHERATLETNYRGAQNLIGKDEKHIRYKRVSFLITISRQFSSDQSKPRYFLNVNSIVEFQRMSDDVWEREQKEDVYLEAIRSVTAKITKLKQNYESHR